MPSKFTKTSQPRYLLYLNAYLPPILWAALIFSLSSQSSLPGPEVSWIDFVFKKMAHIAVYAILWWLVQRGISKTHPHQTWAATWLSLIIVLLYAITDEVHQLFTPSRHPAVRDIGYDMLGAGIAWLRKHDYI